MCGVMELCAWLLSSGRRSRTFEEDVVAAAGAAGGHETGHQSEVLDAVIQHAVALLLLLLKVGPAARHRRTGRRSVGRQRRRPRRRQRSGQSPHSTSAAPCRVLGNVGRQRRRGRFNAVDETPYNAARVNLPAHHHHHHHYHHHHHHHFHQSKAHDTQPHQKTPTPIFFTEINDSTKTVVTSEMKLK